MYKVALLQNQSEAFELSYGDMFSWLSANFNEYQWDLYSTEKSMPDLFQKMDQNFYDAVIFSTNTFNDIYLRKAWANQYERLGRFLENRKGVLVFQQIKLSGENLDMLPDPLAIKIVKRPIDKGENTRAASLSSPNDHVILHYPNELNIAGIVKASIQNAQIEYLYWSYLVLLHPEYWQEVLSDDSYSAGRRPLLVVSGPQVRGRLVITSLVLDWQRQFLPIKNLLTFVVEGIHSMAVIRRSGRTSYDFEYLLHNLRIAKHAFREYIMTELDFSSLYPCIHDVVVLDPAWHLKEISKQQLDIFRSCMKPNARIIYFDVDSFGEPAVTTIGGASPFLTRYQQAIAYLKDAFDRNSGRWDGSYFSTIHVLDTLKKLGEPLDEYKRPFLEYILPHDHDGSYDQQFATTCALLKVYHIFLGSDDERFKRTLSWLNKEIKTKRKVDCDLARAFLAMKECGVPFPLETIRDLARRATPDKVESEENAYRYINLFIAYGLIEEVIPWATRLIQYQNKDGSWGYEERNRLFFTALIADLLLSVKDAVSARGKIVPDLDNSILLATIYLKSLDLISLPPKDKSSTIAAVLQAIRKFENKIRFPIDEFLEEQGIVEREFQTIQTFSTANNLISKLQTDKIQLAEELQKMIKNFIGSRRAANRIGYFILVSIPILVISISLLVNLVIKTSLKEVIQPILSLDPGWIGIFIIFVLIIFGLLARRRIIPTPLRNSIRKVANILSSPATAFEDKEDKKPEEP